MDPKELDKLGLGEAELSILILTFRNFNMGVLNEFQLGVSVASMFVSGDISKDSFQKIRDYFGATEELRVLEYVSHNGPGGQEIKVGLPEATLNFMNLLLEVE
mgnify:CR=1 FL=1